MSSHVNTQSPLPTDAFARAADHLKDRQELTITRAKVFDTQQLKHSNIGDRSVQSTKPKSWLSQKNLTQQRTETLNALRQSIRHEYSTTHGQEATDKAIEAFEKELATIGAANPKKSIPLNKKNVTRLLDALPLYGNFRSEQSVHQNSVAAFKTFIDDLRNALHDAESMYEIVGEEDIYSTINELDATSPHPALQKLMNTIEQQNWREYPLPLNPQNISRLIGMIDKNVLTEEIQKRLAIIVENANQDYNRPPPSRTVVKVALNLGTSSLSGRTLPWGRGTKIPPPKPPRFPFGDGNYMEPQTRSQGSSVNSDYMEPQTRSQSPEVKSDDGGPPRNPPPPPPQTRSQSPEVKSDDGGPPRNPPPPPPPPQTRSQGSSVKSDGSESQESLFRKNPLYAAGSQNTEVKSDGSESRESLRGEYPLYATVSQNPAVKSKGGESQESLRGEYPLYDNANPPPVVHNTDNSAAISITQRLAHIQHKIHAIQEAGTPHITHTSQQGVSSDAHQRAMQTTVDAATRLHGMLSQQFNLDHNESENPLSNATNRVINALSKLIEAARPGAKTNLWGAADQVAAALSDLLKESEPSSTPSLLDAVKNVSSTLSQLIDATQPTPKPGRLVVDKKATETALEDAANKFSTLMSQPVPEKEITQKNSLLGAARNVTNALHDLLVEPETSNAISNTTDAVKQVESTYFTKGTNGALALKTNDTDDDFIEIAQESVSALQSTLAMMEGFNLKNREEIVSLTARITAMSRLLANFKETDNND